MPLIVLGPAMIKNSWFCNVLVVWVPTIIKNNLFCYACGGFGANNDQKTNGFVFVFVFFGKQL